MLSKMKNTLLENRPVKTGAEAIAAALIQPPQAEAAATTVSNEPGESSPPAATTGTVANPASKNGNPARAKTRARRLSETEQKELALQSEIVTGHQKSEFAVGAALLIIQKGRLFRASHKTFESFAADVFHMPRGSAYHLISQAKIYAVLSANADKSVALPVRVEQTRALVGVEDPEQCWAAWKSANAKAKGGVVTRKMVEAAVAELPGRAKSSDEKPAEPTAKSKRLESLETIFELLDKATEADSVEKVRPVLERMGEALTELLGLIDPSLVDKDEAEPEEDGEAEAEAEKP
jgi:hypothetical protein